MKTTLGWIAVSLLAGSLLGGCQITAFEQVPVAAQACDPQLTGRWLSVAEDPGKAGEVELRIDADCQLQVDEHKRDGIRKGDGTPFHVGSHGGHDYAWVDAGWARRRFDPEGVELRPMAGDNYLVRLQRQDDLLTLYAPDSTAIAHRIIDGDIPGEVLYDDWRLHNRITGAVQSDLLEQPGFFDAQPITFRRAAVDPPHAAPKTP